MVVGFNHNIRYKGEVFHVQTEDGGLRSPHIITLLYREGTILASRKSSYTDIIKSEGLEKVVEELMKEQHRAMLRRLKAGDFDGLIAGRAPADSTPPKEIPEEKPTASAAAAPEEVTAQPSAASAPQDAAAVAALEAERPNPPAASAPQAVEVKPSASTHAAPPPAQSLDDLILAYLEGDRGTGPNH